MTDRHRPDNHVVRIPNELWDRLLAAADGHGVTANWLAVKGITEFMAHLIPAEEMKWTR